MKNTKIKNQNAESLFISAAELLINSYRTPEDFLMFLREALGWVHNYERENPNWTDAKDPHFNILYMIEHIVFPWIRAAEKNRVSEIAEGIESYNDFFGHEFHHEITGNLLAAFAKDFDSGIPVPKYLDGNVHGITTLIKLGHFLYEYDRVKEMKSKKFVKAA